MITIQNKIDFSKAYKAAEKSGNATIFINRDYAPNQYGVVIFGRKGDTQEIASVSDKQNYYSFTGVSIQPLFREYKI